MTQVSDKQTQNGRNFTLMGSLETAPLGRRPTCFDQKLDGSSDIVDGKGVTSKECR